MRAILLLIFLFSFFAGMFAQEAQSRSSRYNFYSDEIRAVAPNIPAQPDIDIAKAHEYSREMEQWAADFPNEYQAVRQINRRVALFEPISNTASEGEPMVSFGADLAFLRFPVGEEKPVFIELLKEDLDTVFYEGRLKHWYFLNDKKTFVDKYGPLPEDRFLNKRVSHPDSLYLPASMKPYFPEFYKEVIKHD